MGKVLSLDVEPKRAHQKVPIVIAVTYYLSILEDLFLAHISVRH